MPEVILVLNYIELTLGRILTAAILSFPLGALALGDEVLYTVYFELIALLILIVMTFTIKLNSTGRLIFAAICIVSMGLTLAAVGGLPYDQNQILINIVVVGVPLTIAGFALAILKRRFGKYT